MNQSPCETTVEETVELILTEFLKSADSEPVRENARIIRERCARLLPVSNADTFLRGGLRTLRNCGKIWNGINKPELYGFPGLFYIARAQTKRLRDQYNLDNKEATIGALQRCRTRLCRFLLEFHPEIKVKDEEGAWTEERIKEEEERELEVRYSGTYLTK